MSLAGSPFADRLNTNYVPSDAEIPEIRSSLVGPEAELVRLEAEIELTENVLKQLKARRTSLKEPIDAHKALISPVRRLPEDILEEIFSSCLPSNHNALMDSAEAPLLLGRICRVWRRVAYSTPRLWSSIHIPGSFGASPLVLTNLSKQVEAWLERSAACALSVSLSIFVPSSRSCPHQRQLVSHVFSASRHALGSLLQLGAEDLPRLQRIYIDALFDQSSSVMNVIQLPTLTEVSLRLSSTEGPLSFPLQWSKLTRLRFEWCFKDARIFLHCEFRITVETERTAEDEEPFADASIHLPHIQTFILTGQIMIHKWTQKFVTPMLRHLQIGNADPRDTHDVETRMIARIDPRFFTTTSLQEFLQCFPTISHLHLQNGLIRARIAVQKFEFQFGREMEVDILPELEAYISLGLQVTLRYPPSRWIKFNARKGLWITQQNL
ncbi:hypothetical protein R3P38DRAFT_3307022 [Favolaschia claudopus]|uniref:F-box domain-containing protein n=1 Tax=Favolaschia claudopus TaxID=2862362 RepID=A0AAW0DBS1_9AGAR